MLNGCVVVEWQRRAWSECECSTERRKVSVSRAVGERRGREKGAWVEREREGERENTPVRAKGSMQRIVCKGIRTGAGLGAWQRGWSRHEVQGRLWEGLACSRGLWRGALRWRQGSCCSQSVCDLLPTTKGSHSLPPTPQLFFFCLHLPRLLFSFFNVLIVPTASSGRGKRGGELRGLSSLSHRGLHECSRCGEGEGEREEKRRGPGWETIPPHSSCQPFFSNFKVLLLFWASQLREYTCVWTRQEKRNWEIETHKTKLLQIAPFTYLIAYRNAVYNFS